MAIPIFENIFFGHGGDTFGTHSFVVYNEKDSLSIAYSICGERYSSKLALSF